MFFFIILEPNNVLEFVYQLENSLLKYTSYVICIPYLLEALYQNFILQSFHGALILSHFNFIMHACGTTINASSSTKESIQGNF